MGLEGVGGHLWGRGGPGVAIGGDEWGRGRCVGGNWGALGGLEGVGGTYGAEG